MIRRFGPSFQRFLHNVTAQTFGLTVNVVAQIFSIPAFLHFWPKTEYGEWIVISSIPSLLWTLDSGLSGLAGNRMTVASGAGNWARANEIFHNVLVVQGALSLVILAVAGVLVSVGNLSAFLGFTFMTPAESSEVLFIMIIYMLLGYAQGLLKAVFRASAQEARGVAIFNLSRLTDFIVLISVLSLHGHAVSLASGLACSMGLWAALGYLDARRRCPNITFAFGRLSRAQFTSMTVDGVPLLAATLGGALYLEGYPLMVNWLLGPVAVVTLTTIRTGSRALLQLVAIVTNASVSELSRSYGSRDWEAFIRLLKVLVVVTSLAAIGATIGLTFFGPWVIGIWTSGRVLVTHEVILLFALSVACQCCWNACGAVLFSTNMHHAFNYTYFGLTIAGLGFSSIAVHFLGFAGVPAGMLVVDAILLVWAFRLCSRKLSFVPIASLARALHPSMYREKIAGLFQSSGR